MAATTLKAGYDFKTAWYYGAAPPHFFSKSIKSHLTFNVW